MKLGHVREYALRGARAKYVMPSPFDGKIECLYCEEVITTLPAWFDPTKHTKKFDILCAKFAGLVKQPCLLRVSWFVDATEQVKDPTP